MVDTYTTFTDFGHISARFAARLVNAGVLTALESLAAEALRQNGGPHVRETIATVLQSASHKCLTVFARSVPQVRHWGQHIRRLCCGCMLAHVRTWCEFWHRVLSQHSFRVQCCKLNSPCCGK